VESEATLPPPLRAARRERSGHYGSVSLSVYR